MSAHSRLLIFVGALALGGAGSLSAAPDAAQRRPNILLIVADDLGYADLGVQGCADVPTPHLDALAAGGVRFTDGYVTAPVCSPSRAGLLTGRYQQRFGHEFNSGPAQRAPVNFGLPLEETTLADRLKGAGYRTAAIGKWHLGYRQELAPSRRGFDAFFGFIGGAHSYLETASDGRNPILEGETKVERVDYLTDEFGRRAREFIQGAGARPWFLYLAFNAVHTPMHATEARLARFSAIEDPKRRALAAMLLALDDALGETLQALRDSGQEQDTLVFFLSDNGGPTDTNASRNHPFRGVKGDVFEGGIRVPWLMRWPGRLEAGRVVDTPVSALDVVPTALAAAGVEPEPGLDGIDVLPWLTDPGRAPTDRPLCWRFGALRAVRIDDWKLVDTGGGGQLFNLKNDPAESKDLAEALPEKVRELEAAYATWNRLNIAPAWPSPPRGSD